MIEKGVEPCDVVQNRCSPQCHVGDVHLELEDDDHDAIHMLSLPLSASRS